MRAHILKLQREVESCERHLKDCQEIMKRAKRLSRNGRGIEARRLRALANFTWAGIANAARQLKNQVQSYYLWTTDFTQDERAAIGTLCDRLLAMDGVKQT